MCIAILNKISSKDITKEQLLNCWENNYDGAGLLWSDGEKLNVYKELNDFNKLYNAYKSARKESIGDVLIHFRISTHGKVDKTNCHPFLVNEELGFIHNGIIYEFGYEKLYSDTYTLNRDVFQKLPKNFLDNDGVLNMLDVIIGSSKLVFLNIDGYGLILNEKLGVWDNDNWFSNTSYKSVSRYIDYGGKKVLKNDNYLWTDEELLNNECECCLNVSDNLIFNEDYNCIICDYCNNYLKENNYYNDDEWFNEPC